MSDLQVFPLAIPGGIDESQPRPQPQHLEELDNFGIFRGRVGLRAPIVELDAIEDDHGTEVDAILDIVEHGGFLYILGYNATTDEVHLVQMEVDGTNQTHKDIVWTSVTNEPTARMVSFTGGDANNQEDRLYIFDYNQGQDTKYWVEATTTLTSMSEDLDADGSDEVVQFSLMIGYKFHLWGTGFWDADASSFRPEMIRFSQPGLVPGTDTDGTTGQEWFTDDHRSVGNRGQKIRALSRAGDRLIVFQPRAMHAVYGSGANTWTRQELDAATGCVGPHAATVTDERICYFWASDGPYRTDGSQVQYIGQPIRQSITEVDTDENHVVAGYSPDDGLVYFVLTEAGADEFSKVFVYSHRQGIWATTTWLIDSAANLEISCMVFADAEAPPGPTAAPSSLSATADSDTTIDLSWTNGDTALGVTTTIHRDTSSGLSASPANQVGEVGSGVTTFEDTGLTQDTTYYYVVRHSRNNQNSADSNEANDTTWLEEPSNVVLRGLTNGIEIAGDNGASGADIVIERSTDGSNWSALTTLSNPGASFDHDDTTASCSTVYHYRVRAENSPATPSTWVDAGSLEACTSTSAPAAPSGLNAASDDNDDEAVSQFVAGIEKAEIDLTWTDESDNEDGFEIQRCQGSGCSGWSTIDNVGAGVESYTDDGVTDDETQNTIYRYRVRATNAAGESAWATSGDVTLEPQLTPSSVTAQDTSHCDELTPDPQITVNWAYGDTDDMSQVSVQRQVNGGTWVTVFTDSSSPEATTEYVDDDVNFDDNFNYRIRVNFNGSENRGQVTSPESGVPVLTEPTCS